MQAHYCKVFTDDLSYPSQHHSSLSDDPVPWKDSKYFLKETFANIFVSGFLVGLLGGCGILNNSICSIETYQLCRWVCSTAVVVSYCCKKWWSEDQPWVVLPFTILQSLPSAHWWIWFTMGFITIITIIAIVYPSSQDHLPNFILVQTIWFISYHSYD